MIFAIEQWVPHIALAASLAFIFFFGVLGL